MTPAHGIFDVSDTAEDLAERVAVWFCDRVAMQPGRFVVSLSGGSTPKRLYEWLAAPPFRDRLPWDRMIWTFGDERFVPHTDKDSNYRMVRETLFDFVPIPEENILAFQTENITPDASAALYERQLRDLVQARPGAALLDLTLLGLGDDGHTASLIPGQPVLQVRDRWVDAVPEGRDEVRLTLTYPALESSRQTAFLVSGSKKRAVLDRLLRGDASIPAGALRSQGEVHYFADRDAAGAWAN